MQRHNSFASGGIGGIFASYHHLDLAPPAPILIPAYASQGHQLALAASAVRGRGRAGLPRRSSLQPKSSSSSLFHMDRHLTSFAPMHVLISSQGRWNRINIMEPGAGAAAAAATAIDPLHRCKTIHLVRHAQGVHNVEGETDHSAYMKPDFFDARVTPLGWNQVDRLREHVKKCGLVEKIELVICSPLLRTMQTAVGVFGGESYSNGVSVPPLMVENAADSGRPAVSSLNCPPFLAVEACRERLGVHPCDKRRSITEYRTLFPAIDFSLIESDEDVLWVPDVRETFESLAERGMKFIDWLWTREEREIAVVTHSGLLCHTLRMYSKECHPTVRQEVSKYFANCELRSLVLVDRSMLGSDRPNNNYPGKIPAGLDLPSDDVVAADKKQPCIEEAQERA